MAWLVVNDFSLENTPLELKERIFVNKPEREINDIWGIPFCSTPGAEAIGIGLPNGAIKKLIGRELTWNDEPIEI